MTLSEIEANVNNSLEQLPRNYSAGLCREDAAKALNALIAIVQQELHILKGIQAEVEEDG